MATLQETVAAVIAELQKTGKNLQEADVASGMNDVTLVLGFKDNGDFIRIPAGILNQDIKDQACSVDAIGLEQEQGLLMLARTNVDGTFTSSTPVPTATPMSDGAMSASDKDKLDNVESLISKQVESEQDRAVSAETALKQMATDIQKNTMQSGSLNVTHSQNAVMIGYRNASMSQAYDVEIPIATEEYAGVITANDKKKLNSTTTTVYLSETEYEQLSKDGLLDPETEYNILENE